MSYELRYDGNRFKVYYFSVGDFTSDLSKFGEFLDEVEARGEKVVSVIANTGFVTASWFLGSSFQGVKGFAVVTRKE